MPIRSRRIPIGLKLEIPERKVSERDWSRPYRRGPGKRWRFYEERNFVHYQQVQRKSVFRFHIR